MTRVRTVFATALCLFLCAVIAAQEMHHAMHTSPAFDQLKSLAGEWENRHSSGAVTKVTYKVVSNGSVVMEYMAPSTESEMVTMYSLDGDRIVMTHYCSAGNQPTMQTAPLTAASGKYDFSFVRAAGLNSPDDGHMIALSLSITDKDHITQLWTYQDHGKAMSDTFSFTRVK